MKFASKSVLMLGTAALMAANSSAAVIIDHFGTTQNVSTAGTTFSNVNGGDILGNQRYASLTAHVGAIADSLDVNTTPSELDFNNSPSSRSTLDLIYDGTANTDGLIHFGLNADLTEGGLSNLFLFTYNSDHLVDVIFNIYSGASGSNASTLDTVTQFDSSDHAVAAPFSSFAVLAGSGADFSAVTAITMHVTGVDGLSLALKNNISTGSPAPEPATLAMTGAGLLALGYIARRKVKQ